MDSAVTIQGFRGLRIKFSQNSSSEHWVFCKQHTVREKSAEKPTDRTLFIINVPVYCNETSLRHVFKKCGRVQNVYFHKNPTNSIPVVSDSFFCKTPEIKTFKVAYVVFETEEGLKNALKLNSHEPLILSSKKHNLEEHYGMRKWLREYNSNILDEDEITKQANSYMEKFDSEASEKAKAEADSTEDNDGWTVVTKKGRRPGIARKESVRKKLMWKEKKRRAKKQLLNFYTFQIRETKMKNLMKLRDKLEEDKKKIQMLKQTRKFKPF